MRGFTRRLLGAENLNVVDAHVTAYAMRLKDEYPDDVPRRDQDFLGADIDRLLGENGVHGCLVLQVLPTTTKAFLGLPSQSVMPMGLIPRIDFHEDSVETRVAELGRIPRVRGFRIFIDDAASGTVTSEFLGRGLRAMRAGKHPLDILARADQLSELADSLRAVGLKNRRIVLNHLGCPPLDRADTADWKRGMSLLAGIKNVRVKTSLHFGDRNFFRDRRNVRWYLNVLTQVMEWFGSKRVIYASDFPDAEIDVSYGELFDAMNQWIDKNRIPVSSRAEMFGDNARRVYGSLEELV